MSIIARTIKGKVKLAFAETTVEGQFDFFDYMLPYKAISAAMIHEAAGEVEILKNGLPAWFCNCDFDIVPEPTLLDAVGTKSVTGFWSTNQVPYPIEFFEKEPVIGNTFSHHAKEDLGVRKFEVIAKGSSPVDNPEIVVGIYIKDEFDKKYWLKKEDTWTLNTIMEFQHDIKKGQSFLVYAQRKFNDGTVVQKVNLRII